MTTEKPLNTPNGEPERKTSKEALMFSDTSPVSQLLKPQYRRVELRLSGDLLQKLLELKEDNNDYTLADTVRSCILKAYEAHR